ncbi:MAG: thioesterase family protein [Deltaproteobacteria bacterium]|nr:thioesterase family protein [Deltaproteobacteria bacterium]
MVSIMPMIEFDDLLACLEIESSAGDRYRLPNLKMPYHRIFGGQLIAQAIVMATHSAAGKAVKSIHALLPRTGDLAEPVEWELERIQDGRSFAARSIVGRQNDELIFSAQLSLHLPEDGPEHQVAFPDAGDPESATTVELSMVPWETRAAFGVDLQSREVGPPDYALWMRAPSVPHDQALHQALLAYSSTLTLIGTALRPHEGVSEADAQGRLQTAVTSHTLWFHRPLRMDKWLLLQQQSPCTAGARGFGLGHAFSSEGQLVASFAQESLIRPSSG